MNISVVSLAQNLLRVSTTESLWLTMQLYGKSHYEKPVSIKETEESQNQKLKEKKLDQGGRGWKMKTTAGIT